MDENTKEENSVEVINVVELDYEKLAEAIVKANKQTRIIK